MTVRPTDALCSHCGELLSRHRWLIDESCSMEIQCPGAQRGFVVIDESDEELLGGGGGKDDFPPPPRYPA